MMIEVKRNSKDRKGNVSRMMTMLIKRLVCIITVLLLIVNFLLAKSGFKYKHQVALNDHHLNIKTSLVPRKTWSS